jgi:hypothetical protein
VLTRLLGDPDPVRAKRAMEAMLQVSRNRIDALWSAYGR